MFFKGFKTTMHPKDQQRHLPSSFYTFMNHHYYKIETPFCLRIREKLRETFNTAHNNNEATDTKYHYSLHSEQLALPYDCAL